MSSQATLQGVCRSSQVRMTCYSSVPLARESSIKKHLSDMQKCVSKFSNRNVKHLMWQNREKPPTGQAKVWKRKALVGAEGECPTTSPRCQAIASPMAQAEQLSRQKVHRNPQVKSRSGSYRACSSAMLSALLNLLAEGEALAILIPPWNLVRIPTIGFLANSVEGSLQRRQLKDIYRIAKLSTRQT